MPGELGTRDFTIQVNFAACRVLVGRERGLNFITRRDARPRKQTTAYKLCAVISDLVPPSAADYCYRLSSFNH
jgi:hypothetical protein